jgi:hypothetical protein
MKDIDRYLIVPIVAEILLVGKNRNKCYKLTSITPNFNNMHKYNLGDKMSNEIFTELRGETYLEPGAHLHWALPDALTAGTQNHHTNGVDFPAVPNRWAVIRIYKNPKISKLSCKAWKIESDALCKDQKTPHNQTSATIPDFSAEPTHYFIGRSGDYEETLPKANKYMEKLTAIGGGDPMFSSFYHNCRNVFGLHDDLAGVESGPVSYVIAGWYQSSSDDPLNGITSAKDFAEKLQEFRWNIKPSGEFYNALICHCCVTNVEWKGPTESYETGVPQEEVEKVVLGNSSVEALSALLAEATGKAEAERLLQALSYNLVARLGDCDGLIEVEEKIVENSYTALEGGINWIICRLDSDQASEDFPAEARRLLDDLNTNQTQADKLENEIESRKRELYSLWYKYIQARTYSQHDDTKLGASSPRSLTEEAVKKVKELLKQKKELLGKRQVLEKQIKALIATQGYSLKAQAGSRFWQPNNPALMLAGKGIKRSYKHGADGHCAADGLMMCRVFAQAADKFVFAANELSLNDLFDAVKLAPALKSLLAEAVLLDDHQLDFLARLLLEKDKRETYNSALEKLKKSQSEARERAYGYLSWSPPWTPLFMEWAINYLNDDDVDPAKNPYANWDFGDYGMDWKKPSLPDTKLPASYKGFVPITPHAVINVRGIIENFLAGLDKASTEYAKFKELADRVADMKVLSQFLSGFNEGMVMYKPDIGFPIYDTDKADAELAKEVRCACGEFNNLYPRLDWHFHPVRAGFLAIDTIWIVDAFGRIQNAFDKKKTKVILSEHIKTEGNAFTGWATLPPQKIQPHRLNIKHLPVCGWLVPNLLNGSLMVCSREGKLLSVLYPKTIDGKKGVARLDFETTLRDAIEPVDPETKSRDAIELFVQGIIDNTENEADAFGIFMRTVFTACNTTINENPATSLLNITGTPLALVKAGLQIAMKGRPYYHQACGEQNTGSAGIPIPVRIGDPRKTGDGLLGFYLDAGDKTSFDTFYSSHYPADTKYLNRNMVVNITDEITMYLLLDAYSGVTVTPAALPPKYFNLPQGSVPKTWSGTDAIFLSQYCIKTGTMRLPLEKSGSWSWHYRDVDSWKTETCENINNQARDKLLRLAEQQISEGWLVYNEEKK